MQKEKTAKVEETRKLVCSKFPEYEYCPKSQQSTIEKSTQPSNYIGGYEFGYDYMSSINDARESLIKICGVGEIISSLPATDIESMMFSITTKNYENTLIKKYCKSAINQIDNFQKNP